jgi:hypothetical protein
MTRSDKQCPVRPSFLFRNAPSQRIRGDLDMEAPNSLAVAVKPTLSVRSNFDFYT